MINRSTDGKIRVLSLSYGKDSLACLGAIEQLGLPLDRIVHAEVWATDTIPADLPPMVEFKKKADAIIKERWGFEVEHICAMKPCLQTVNVERERAEQARLNEEHTRTRSTQNTSTRAQTENKLHNQTRMGFTVSPSDVARGVIAGSKSECCQPTKQTYSEIFYRKIAASGRIYGFPMRKGNWCTALKTSPYTSPCRVGQIKIA